MCCVAHQPAPTTATPSLRSMSALTLTKPATKARRHEGSLYQKFLVSSCLRGLLVRSADARPMLRYPRSHGGLHAREAVGPLDDRVGDEPRGRAGLGRGRSDRIDVARRSRWRSGVRWG